MPAGRSRFLGALAALLAVAAVAVVAVVLVTRTGPVAPTPAPTPIDLAELASYPPVASTPPDESVTLTGAGDIASCALHG